ncbi:hypothetical protein LJR289_003275 [Pseudoduganella sp. LjRoot289]|uniref:hypothetical protein n=1 Tax=Pseudoduganella sp. LjRoot289 TaxID=3342314 RepID=UPI003ED094B4
MSLHVRYSGHSGYFGCVAMLAALAGCGTLTESPTQQVLVQTVLDHREVAGAGCLLYNDAGKWFVTTPARVTIRKSSGQLRVDCRKDNAAWAFEKIDSRENSTLWGNIALTAGIGYVVDRNTGQGFDYPEVLTVVMQRLPPGDPHAAPDTGRTVY